MNHNQYHKAKSLILIILWVHSILFILSAGWSYVTGMEASFAMSIGVTRVMVYEITIGIVTIGIVTIVVTIQKKKS